MTITKAQLGEIAQQLPKLSFVPARDSGWVTSPDVHAYLDFYHINFMQDFPEATQGFGYINAAEFRIATHYWLPPKAQGTLLVVHGYYDHVGLLQHVIRFALARNLAVLAFDLPGHGLSSGKVAEINSFDQYGDLLAEILQQSQHLMPQPLHALGQSTGCAAVLNYLWRYPLPPQAPERLNKIILCAPLVLPRGWFIGQFIYALVRPFIKHISRGRSHSSHDQAFNQFISEQDCLQSKYLSVTWVGAMKAWAQQFNALAPLQKEVLIIQGTGDKTVNWRYNLPAILNKLPRTKIIKINDAGHQLVNESETYRTHVFSAVARYLDTY